MNETELLREISVRTGLPESAAESVLRALRSLVHDGVVQTSVLSPAAANVVSADAPHPAAPERLTVHDPKDPGLVEDLIARARRHPLGLEFLLSGFLASVAMALGAHAFTVEAARARLRKEKAAAAAEEVTV